MAGETLIVYAHYPPFDFGYPEIRITPTREEWAHFWAKVAAARVWDWKPEYDAMILDGTQWSLCFHHAGRRVESHGNNAYPNCRGNSYRRGSAFDRVERAVRRLARLPEWRD